MMNKLFSAQFLKSVLAGLILALLASGSSRAGNSEASSEGGSLKTAIHETGVASFYGAKYHGRHAANGEIFNMNDLTAAHPTLKFGTKVKVTHLASQRAVVVRINDRGPFVKGRVIDLSQAAAAELQMLRAGLAEVKIEIVE
jgi:rare lipoprotein A